MFLDTFTHLLSSNSGQKHLLGLSCQSLPGRLGVKLGSCSTFMEWFVLLLRWHFLSVSCLLRVVQPGSWLRARALHLLHTPPLPTPTGPEVLIITSTGHGDVSSPHAQREGSFLTSHSSQAVLIAQSRVCIHKTGSPALSHLCSHTRRSEQRKPPRTVQSN